MRGMFESFVIPNMDNGYGRRIKTWKKVMYNSNREENVQHESWRFVLCKWALPTFRFHASYHVCCTPPLFYVPIGVSRSESLRLRDYFSCIRSCLMLSGLFRLRCVELPSLPVGAAVKITKFNSSIDRETSSDVQNWKLAKNCWNILSELTLSEVSRPLKLQSVLFLFTVV